MSINPDWNQYLIPKYISEPDMDGDLAKPAEGNLSGGEENPGLSGSAASLDRAAEDDASRSRSNSMKGKMTKSQFTSKLSSMFRSSKRGSNTRRADRVSTDELADALESASIDEPPVSSPTHDQNDLDDPAVDTVDTAVKVSNLPMTDVTDSIVLHGGSSSSKKKKKSRKNSSDELQESSNVVLPHLELASEKMESYHNRQIASSFAGNHDSEVHSPIVTETLKHVDEDLDVQPIRSARRKTKNKVKNELSIDQADVSVSMQEPPTPSYDDEETSRQVFIQQEAQDEEYPPVRRSARKKKKSRSNLDSSSDPVVDAPENSGGKLANNYDSNNDEPLPPPQMPSKSKSSHSKSNFASTPHVEPAALPQFESADDLDETAAAATVDDQSLNDAQEYTPIPRKAGGSARKKKIKKETLPEYEPTLMPTYAPAPMPVYAPAPMPAYVPVMPAYMPTPPTHGVRSKKKVVHRSVEELNQSDTDSPIVTQI